MPFSRTSGAKTAAEIRRQFAYNAGSGELEGGTPAPATVLTVTVTRPQYRKPPKEGH